MFRWSPFQSKWWTHFTWLMLIGYVGWSVNGENANESAVHRVAADVLHAAHPIEIVPPSQNHHEVQQSAVAPEGASKQSAVSPNHVDPAAEPPRRSSKLTTPQGPRALVNPLAPSSSNRTGQRPADGEGRFDSGRAAAEEVPPKRIVVASVNATNASEIGNRSQVEPRTEESEWTTSALDSQDLENSSGNGEIEATSDGTVTSSGDDLVADGVRNASARPRVSVFEVTVVPLDEELLRAASEAVANRTRSNLVHVRPSLTSSTVPESVRDDGSLELTKAVLPSTREPPVGSVEDTAAPDHVRDVLTVTSGLAPSSELGSNLLVPVATTGYSGSFNSSHRMDTSPAGWTLAAVVHSNLASPSSNNDTLDDAILNNSSVSAITVVQDVSIPEGRFNSSYRDDQSNVRRNTSEAFSVTPAFSTETSSGRTGPGVEPSHSSDLVSVTTRTATRRPNLELARLNLEGDSDSPLPPNSLLQSATEISPSKWSAAEKGGGESKADTDADKKTLNGSTKEGAPSNRSKAAEVDQHLDDGDKPAAGKSVVDEMAPSNWSDTWTISPTQSSTVHLSSPPGRRVADRTGVDASGRPSTDGNTTSGSPAAPTGASSWSRSDGTKRATRWKDKQPVTPTMARPDGVLPTIKIPLTYLSVTMHCSWSYFCSHLERFQRLLAEHLSGAAKDVVKGPQVVFFNTNACNHVSTNGELDQKGAFASTISVSLYVVDRRGDYSKTLTERLGLVILRNGLRGFGDNVTLHDVVQAVQVHRKPGDTHAVAQKAAVENDTGIIAAITISCIAAVCLVLLCVLLAVLKRRHGSSKQTRRCRKATDAYSLDSISIYSSFYKRKLRASKRSYLNQGFEDPQAPTNKMTYTGMIKFCSVEEDVIQEYKKIPMTVAKLEDLPPGADVKNRYANVIPFPETRVQLPVKGEDLLSEYINANYVRGFLGDQRVYIACQAPMDNTVVDFWEMVWENQSKVVIMLTALHEDGVEKCAPYFAESAAIDSHRLFGDYQVTTKKVDAREMFTISFLQLKNLEKNLIREVIHFWYTAWPAQGLPDDSTSVIEMLLEARPMMKVNPGPNVVHCSPGTGRTGTVIAVDICMQEYESARSVDVPQCVYRLRRDRGGLVQTSEQFLYIYKTLIEYASRILNQSGRSSLRSTK